MIKSTMIPMTIPMNGIKRNGKVIIQTMTMMIKRRILNWKSAMIGAKIGRNKQKRNIPIDIFSELMETVVVAVVVFFSDSTLERLTA